MAEVDPTFFARLKYSNISPLDSNKKFSGSLLFPDKKDRNFYHDYPTIYHLRDKLMMRIKNLIYVRFILLFIISLNIVVTS